MPIFVIQKHAASTLHYDFRLEIGGVLKSWVLPKGPSTDPRDKRLAVPTEDHSMDYADFEGVIAEGQYGAGAVLVWDTGPYRRLPAENDNRSLDEALAEGRFDFWLEGKKLRGGYTLVRMAQSPNWLLIKKKDAAADSRRRPLESQTGSVLSGRTLDEIRAENNPHQ